MAKNQIILSKTQYLRWAVGFLKKLVGIEPRPTFNDEQTEKLAALLGVSRPKCVATLQENLNNVASLYRPTEHTDSWEKPGEIREAMGEIHQLASMLLERMNGLPPRTRANLLSSYSRARFDYEENFKDGLTKEVKGHIKLERDIKHLKRLRTSIEFYRREIPIDKGGRPGQSNLDRLARRLGGIYQDVTGKPFVGPTSVKAGKEAPGEFVRKAVSIIAPGSAPSAVDLAMKRAARFLKEAGELS